MRYISFFSSTRFPCTWRGLLSRGLRLAPGVTALVLLVVLVVPTAPASLAAEVVNKVHYSYDPAGGVVFDWRGPASDIRFGTTTAYGTTVALHTLIRLA